eukprot:11175030-Lingulodinium_polyedra.AAC.1
MAREACGASASARARLAAGRHSPGSVGRQLAAKRLPSFWPCPGVPGGVVVVSCFSVLLGEAIGGSVSLGCRPLLRLRMMDAGGLGWHSQSPWAVSAPTSRRCDRERVLRFQRAGAAGGQVNPSADMET